MEITHKVVNYVVGAIYRHPRGNSQHYIQDLDQMLRKIPPEKICLITGDININLLQYQKKDVGDYLTTMASHNFLTVITLPTRFSDYSSSIIDHIFIRYPIKFQENVIKSGNLLVNLLFGPSPKCLLDSGSPLNASSRTTNGSHLY